MKDDDTNLMEKLQEKNEDIYNWLNDAQEKGQKVIYLTIGSECYLVDWSKEEFKKGIQLLTAKGNIRVIWQLPKVGTPGQEHPFG